MHYYSRHIGDYAKDTGHLSHLEHGSYNVLLDYYYATERPLPADDEELRRVCRVVSRQERESVARILSKFFILTPQGWMHKRVERELALQRLKVSAASVAGKTGAMARATARAEVDRKFNDRSTTVATVAPTVDQPSQEPLTNNQDPLGNGAVVTANPETIVAAYPRRDHPLECLMAVEVAIRAGDDPGAILAAVRLVASYIANAPGGSSNAKVPTARGFFTGQQWRSPEAFENRWTDAGKKRKGGAVGDEESGGAPKLPRHDPEPNWDWRRMWEALYGRIAPDWGVVPEDNRKEILAFLSLEPRDEWRGALQRVCEAEGIQHGEIAEAVWDKITENVRVSVLCDLWKRKPEGEA